LNGKVAASVYKNASNGRGDSLPRPRDTLYPLKLALSSPTSGDRSVGIVHLRTKATEFVFVCIIIIIILRTMVAVEYLLVGSPKPDRSKMMIQTKRETLC
jgi:hypothetical protein